MCHLVAGTHPYAAVNNPVSCESILSHIPARYGNITLVQRVTPDRGLPAATVRAQQWKQKKAFIGFWFRNVSWHSAGP